jgi:tripartite-type tricarboxylate transporter receptor subunit TctC
MLCNRRRWIARTPWFLAIAIATSLCVQSRPLHAQDYPNRTVRIVVPFPAGGSADAIPRIVADWLSRKWGQAVIIENKAGAAGNIGMESVFRAEPDGYTLMATPQPPIVTNHTLYPKLGYDPAELEPIVMMARIPTALVVTPGLQAKTVAEFIAAARANPGKFTAATQGNGTTSHLTSELFQMMAQVKLQTVPYRGSAPALQDLLAGNVDVMFDNLGVSLALVKGDKLKLIAVATPKRIAALPEVPTIAETLPGFDSAAWFSIVAPPKTPQAVVTAVNAAVNEALRQPEVIKRLAELSAEPLGGSPQDMLAYLRQDVARWNKVIETAHVKLDQ